ncbi:hypothetical protein HD554DRAFT_2099360 [Boletus coccyginus]|nr:hypothetical protein HD554DRAFT_2099360 [Boletus coccyginus]
MSSCQRCRQTGSGPQAFLLTCQGCSKTWHHRCHMPPVEDEDLIQLIRATTRGDKDNDLSSWMCRRCRKGASGTPSAVSSREPTASSDSREGSRSVTSGHGPAARHVALAASVADVRVKQELSTTVDVRLVNDQKSDRQESTETAPVKRALIAKRTKQSAANPSHVQPRPRDADVQMATAISAKFTPQEKKRSPQRPPSPTHPHHIKAARKLISTVSETSISEDDVEMEVVELPPTSSELTSRTTSRVSQATSSGNRAIRSESVAEAPAHLRPASSTNQREREVWPADRAVIQPQVNQVAANEVDDDPDDLYGPPVERRIIRILPSLAEELREQQRRAAAEKVKRAPLAPDWIFAKHVNDPLWKEIPTEGRKQRKPITRKLGDNGLNVDELMGCFTVQNWVREHKT